MFLQYYKVQRHEESTKGNDYIIPLLVLHFKIQIRINLHKTIKHLTSYEVNELIPIGEKENNIKHDLFTKHKKP